MASVKVSTGHKIGGPVGAVAVIAVATVAQGQIVGREYLVDGLFLYTIALLLGFRFLPKLPSADHPKAVDASRAAGKLLNLNRTGVWVGIATLAVNLIALSLFSADSHLTLAWMLFGVSIVSAPVSIWLLSGKPQIRPFSGWQSMDIIALVIVLIVAAAFRLHRLDSLPYGLWWDEAFSGLEVLKIMNDPSYRPLYLAEPAFYRYLMVGSFALLSPSMLGLRIVAVAGGMLGVLAISLLGRELFGRRVGLVAGFFVATMAWHVNFSRIAFNAIWSVAFDALSVYFLIQGMRTGRLLSFALAGTALGLGFNMYYTSRLIPLILFLYLGRRLFSERRAFFTRHLPGLLVFCAVTLITISPLAQFALQNPEEFNSRANQVTIMNEVQRQGSYAPLVENLRKHILMFHYEGDGNGRHNLPRAPMVDQVTAALLILGLLMAVRQPGRTEVFLLLTWSVVMLSGGVLSLSYEAPQGLRTIDEISAIALLASLPVVALWRQLQQLQLGEFRLVLPPGLPDSWQVAVLTTTFVVIALLAIVGILNYQRYFEYQARDYGSWSVFSTAETEIGRQIKAAGPVHEVLLGETFVNHPTIEFLTGRKDYRQFEPAVHLPLSGIRNAAIFLEPHNLQALELLRSYYPQADTRMFKSPKEGTPILVSAMVRQEEIASLQGLTGSYYPNTEWKGEPALTEKGVATRFEGNNPRLPDLPYSATWQGVLSASEYGRYLFKLEGPPTARLYIDEEPLLSSGEESSLVLAKGLHAIRINAIVEDSSPIAVLWQPPGVGILMPIPREAVFGPPVTNNGLLGSYYGNKRWEGEAAFQRIDPFLNMRIHLLPLQRPYSVEWRGKIEAPRSGVYRFATESADTSWVYINDKLVVTNEGANRQMIEGTVHLDEGLHDIAVRFFDESGHSFLRVYWTPPGGQRELLPRERLYPPQGAYRTSTPAKEPLPTVAQQGIPVSITPNMVRVEYLSSIVGPPGHLMQPKEVAVNPDGQVYVVDREARRVSYFTPEGALVGQFQAEFVEPFAVAVAPGGQLFVLDSKGREPIMMFTPDGRLLSQMGGNLGMYSPRGLFIDPSGALYVADTGRGRVLKLASTGQLLGEFRGSGQLEQPVAVVAAGDGTMYVADAEKHQMLVLDAKDQVLRSWAMMPATTFDAPDVALGLRGELYVSDPRNGVVRVFDQEGRTLTELGSPGDRNGQFNLPTGICVDGSGQLWVADTGNKRVQRWIIR
ncbi:MAG: PA14 domain-containing protein [Chloroflexota bacterium]